MLVVPSLGNIVATAQDILGGGPAARGWTAFCGYRTVDLPNPASARATVSRTPGRSVVADVWPNDVFRQAAGQGSDEPLRPFHCVLLMPFAPGRFEALARE